MIVFAPGMVVDVQDGPPSPSTSTAIPSPVGHVTVYAQGVAVEVIDIAPEPPVLGVQLESTLLNRWKVLQFRDWGGSPYQRHIPNLTFGPMKGQLDIQLMNYNGVTPPYTGTLYHVTCDGQHVSSAVPVPGEKYLRFRNLDFSSFGNNYRVLRIVPDTPTGETDVPFYVYISQDGTFPQEFAPIQSGSFNLAMQGDNTARWGKAPLVTDPPRDMRPEPRSDFIHFNHVVDPKLLYRRNLVPFAEGDIPFLRVLPDGRKTCLNTHAYAFNTIISTFPELVLRDGSYGEAKVSAPTHIHIGRRGSTYFTDSWSTGKIDSVTGEVTRFSGWVMTDDGWVLKGDWSAVPEDRRGYREIWGATWWGHAVSESTLDASRLLDRGDGVMEHPHTLPPTQFIADSQWGRIIRERHSPDEHGGEVIVDEWVTGLSDSWSVVEVNNVLYVSERQAHRISMWSAEIPQTFLGVLIETPNGNAFGTVNNNRRPIRHQPLDLIRQQACVLPEGLAYIDGKLLIASITMGQCTQVDLTTHEANVRFRWNPVSKSEYAQIAASDGTFYPRGTVFLTAWEVDRGGYPWAFLPDGTSVPLIINKGGIGIESGLGGSWNGLGYSTAVGVGQGRLVCGGAKYGIAELSLGKPGDITLDNTKYVQGEKDYEAQGGRLKTGMRGHRQWKSTPLPWDFTTNCDYYLASHGHAYNGGPVWSLLNQP